MRSQATSAATSFMPPFVGTLAEIVENALAIPFLVVVLALVGVFLALGEHGADQTNEFVGGSGHGPGFVHA